jgi:hypothetical protein
MKKGKPQVTQVIPVSRFARDVAVQVFTPPRKHWAMAVASSLFFSVMTAVGICLPYANPDGSVKNPAVAAGISGFVFGAFALLSLFALLECRRSRLLVSSAEIRVVGAFRDRTVALAEITRAKWRRIPKGGSVVLYAPVGRVVIEFASYDRRRELRALLHESIPLPVQEDYERFRTAFPSTPRSPVVVSETAAVQLAIASLVITILCAFLWEFRWMRAIMFPLAIMISPAIAIATGLDCVRRPTRRTILAATLAFAAVGCLVVTLVPALRPLFN